MGLLAAIVLVPACKSQASGDAESTDAAFEDALPNGRDASALDGASHDVGSLDGARDAEPRDQGAIDAFGLDGQTFDTLPPVDAGGSFCELPGQNAPGLMLPSGFCSRVFAQVPCPRSLRFAPNGDVFVASPAESTPGGAPTGMGSILVLPDDNHDGVADGMVTFASGSLGGNGPSLFSVHGLHFRSNALLFSTGFPTSDSSLDIHNNAVWSIPYTPGDRHSSTVAPTKLVDMSDGEPNGCDPHMTGYPLCRDRWTHNIAEDTNGNLYVSRGQYDNEECPSVNPRVGSVLRIGGGSSPQGDVMITGLRNPMYIRCMPWGACYAAELSGDGWDSIGGKEKLALIAPGIDYGYPCCVDQNRANPFISPTPDCSMVSPAAASFTLHDTPFGFDWERGHWPAPYASSFFVAMHGQFGSWIGEGIAWAPVDPQTHIPTQATQLFGTGWSLGGPIVGRPADLMFAPDGRLFISDDQSGMIFWIAPVNLPR
jgi:glucose/arabinose dehydrogenase